MKIITQSTTLQKAPYFHLAYLAASSMTPSRGYLGAGLFVLLFGCILSSQFAKCKNETKKHWTQIPIILRKNNPILLKVGLLCSLIGCAIVLVSFLFGERRYIRPTQMTKVRMHMIRHLISAHSELGEPIPENMSSLSKQWQLSASNIEDGWFNQMQLTKTTENEAIQYVITSAGQDRIFDTEDDMKSNVVPRQKKESEEVN